MAESSSLWTDERIRRAVPKLKRSQKQKRLFRSAQAKSTSFRVAKLTASASVTVSDDDREKPPYNSVGLLLFTVDGEDFHGTAYAAKAGTAKNVIFTAAHNLKDSDGDSKNIEFVPAMQSNLSKPFGSFKGTSFVVHPSYSVQTEPDAYDLGAVKLQKNAAGQELGDAVPLLDIMFDKQYTSSSSFTTVGFPEEDEMQQNTGKYLRSEDSGETIIKEGEIPEGSSGGPWLFEGNSANGNTACGGNDEDNSPYYSKTKINAVLNLL